MTLRSIISFYLRTSPGAFRFGAIPLVFLIPYFDYITGASSTFEQVMLLSLCAFAFNLVLCINCLTMGGGVTQSPLAQPPHAEFLVTRAVDRGRLWLVYVAMFQVLFLAPSLVSLVLALWHPEFRLRELASGGDYSSALKQLALYQQSFSGTWIEYGKIYATLVVPDGRLLSAAWRLVILIFIASAVQVFVLRRWRIPQIDKGLALGLIGAAVLFGVSLSLFRSQFVMAWEAAFLLFIKYWPLFFALALLVFFAIQIWSIRRARGVEVL